MSGSQHPFSPGFGGAGQNDLRSQFGGPQRGQLPSISSPGQPAVGIASPQTYNVGVSIQPPADSPIQSQQLQQPGTPSAQQLQLHVQQQRQQQVTQQSVENPQQPQQASSMPQQGVPTQHSPASQQTGLQPLQQVSSPARLAAGDGSMQSVSQSAVGAGGAVSTAVVSGPTPQHSANQQYNTASLCNLGLETVQEIVSKLQETFHILKSVLPPSGSQASANVSNEKRQKLCECLKLIRQLFKRLRFVYERVNDNSQLQGAEYMHIESLIPLKEEWDVKTSEERKTSESYRLASDECKELIDQVIVKNGQIKEVIDRLRRIVWEINTMLTMIKS